MNGTDIQAPRQTLFVKPMRWFCEQALPGSTEAKAIHYHFTVDVEKIKRTNLGNNDYHRQSVTTLEPEVVSIQSTLIIENHSGS